MAHYDPHGILILMHNRLGLRIEFNADHDGHLQLWYSPLAGQSIDYRDRNFSNRDDHTSVFGQISLPGLSKESFQHCHYDPFHSIVSFKHLDLHLLSVYDEPSVILWMSAPQSVDFKTKPDDTIVERSIDCFSVTHRDRARSFRFVARFGSGESFFVHQKQIEVDRSQYARAKMAEGEPLILMAGLEKEKMHKRSTYLSRLTTDEHLSQLNKSINAALKTGQVSIREKSDWSSLHRVCREHLLSARDTSGAVRAALNRIYYLIWVRDGAFIENSIAATGWDEGAGKWPRFLLANPTEIKSKNYSGQAFLMLVNQLTKWEEDGLFYAVWSAFTAWTQWDQAPTETELNTMRNAVNWLERYCFSNSQKLFGRSFACESPFFGSRDFGFDNAVGSPCDTPPPRAQNGQRVLLAYDLYINEAMFSTYCMLAAMLPRGDVADSYLAKARNLRNQMASWYHEDLPPYGELLLEDGSFAIEPPYGLDLTDYIWGLTAPPFPSQPQRSQDIRKRLLKEAPKRAPDYFLCAYFTLIASIDSWHTGESELEEAINYAVTQSLPPGETLAMPYAIKEKLDVLDGDRWHDVRPQSFSAGPYLACIHSLLLRRLPFGLSVRPSAIIDTIKSYSYRGKLIDLDNQCSHASQKIEIIVNKVALCHTLQVPENLLSKSRNTIKLLPSDQAMLSPILLSSSIRLIAVIVKGPKVIYQIEGYGFCSMTFHGTEPMNLEISESCKHHDGMETYVCDNHTVINFWANGSIEVSLSSMT